MVMWSGVCSIGYYISYLLETSVGLSHNLSLLLSGFNGLWYVVSALFPFVALRRFGKRWCLLIGAFGMGCVFSPCPSPSAPVHMALPLSV